jgi:hypothetical protein
MRLKVIKWLVWLIMAVLLMFTGLGAAAEGEFPELNEDGFLDSGEFVYENPEDGVWRYVSDTLKIEIFRMKQKKPVQVWYEAEIWCAEGSEMPHMIPNNSEAWFGNKNADYPYKICRKTGTVLAVNSDYCQTRMQQKITVGIIIRNGVIYSERTKAKGGKWPNLDCLALFPDGDMQVYYSNEKTAQEYLNDGVQDVLSFGPWLIRDGEMNTKALEKYGRSKAPRTAVGMVEKGHYFFMMLEGRLKGRSDGAGIDFLAEKLQEKGCQTAFNLDGGDTCSIVFMGHQICQMTLEGNGKKSGRRTHDILGVGTSDLLPSLDDPF